MTLQKYDTLNDHIALAKFAHFKQLDLAGMPYIGHPLRVLDRAKGRGARPYVLSAAVLHDITEDTRFTIPILFDLGVPEPVLILVDLLDRKNLSKEEYLVRIKENEDARLLKLDDIADNTLPWRMNYLNPERQERKTREYAEAMEFLTR